MPFKDPGAGRAYKAQYAKANKERLRLYKQSRRAIDREVEREVRNRPEVKERINAQRRVRYAKNVEKHRKRSREYAASHRQEQKRRSREWYQQNKDHARELQRLYIQKHAETLREWHRQHHQKNRERKQEQSKAWAKNNPEKARAYSHKAHLNRRAKKRAAFIESVDPEVVFKRDKGKCGICKKRVDPNSRWDVDHIIPISKGGAHSYDNVQVAHGRCNRIKHAKLPKGQPTLFQVIP